MPRNRSHRNSSKKAHHPAGVRAFWSGTITFGLVNVPVHLFPANRRTGASLRMLSPSGTPLSRRYYCPEEGRDVHSEHILRGFPLEGDEYVIVRDEELEAIEPKKSREIDLRQFVKLEEISPMFFNRAYYLTPGGDSNKAYRLLAAVMEDSGRAGIATFVMRDREYLIAILAEDGILRAQTLRFEDELRTPEDVGLPPKQKPNTKEVAMLKKLIDERSSDKLDEAALKDEYTRKIQQLAKKKRKQKRDVVRAPDAGREDIEDADEAAPTDLLESIRRSLQRQPTGGSNGAAANGRRTQDSFPEDLKSKSKDELYERAKELDIPGRSKLNKQQLIRAISQAR